MPTTKMFLLLLLLLRFFLSWCPCGGMGGVICYPQKLVLAGIPHLYLWKSSGLALCLCFPKEISCWDLADLHPLVSPTL